MVRHGRSNASSIAHRASRIAHRASRIAVIFYLPQSECALNRYYACLFETTWSLQGSCDILVVSTCFLCLNLFSPSRLNHYSLPSHLIFLNKKKQELCSFRTNSYDLNTEFCDEIVTKRPSLSEDILWKPKKPLLNEKNSHMVSEDI